MGDALGTYYRAQANGQTDANGPSPLAWHEGAVRVHWIGKMLKRLFGKREPQKEPEMDPKDEATRMFYELAALYTLSFHRHEPKPDWFYDRIEQLERELGDERARAALVYASDHESFYYRLMY